MEGCLKKLVLEAEAMGFWGLGKSGWKPLAVSRRKYWAGSAQLKANGFILTSRRAKKLIPDEGVLLALQRGFIRLVLFQRVQIFQEQ